MSIMPHIQQYKFMYKERLKMHTLSGSEKVSSTDDIFEGQKEEIRMVKESAT